MRRMPDSVKPFGVAFALFDHTHVQNWPKWSNIDDARPVAYHPAETKGHSTI
jgi:hypothetical protein